MKMIMVNSGFKGLNAYVPTVQCHCLFQSADDMQHSLDNDNFTMLASTTYTTDPLPQLEQIKVGYYDNTALQRQNSLCLGAMCYYEARYLSPTDAI